MIDRRALMFAGAGAGVFAALPAFAKIAVQPPASVITCAPREYDATSAASVVASGT